MESDILFEIDEADIVPLVVGSLEGVRVVVQVVELGDVEEGDTVIVFSVGVTDELIVVFVATTLGLVVLHVVLRCLVKLDVEGKRDVFTELNGGPVNELVVFDSVVPVVIVLCVGGIFLVLVCSTVEGVVFQ